MLKCNGKNEPIRFAAYIAANQTTIREAAPLKIYRLIPLFLAGVLALLLCGCAGRDTGADDTRYIFSVVHAHVSGNAYSDLAEGYYPAGTSVTAHAVPIPGASFFCWSTGGYAGDGGTVVSYREDYTFTLSADTYLYANFRAHDSVYVLYHANGGTAAQTGADYVWDEFSLAYYLYPNALPDMDYFERDGYVLLGYATEPGGGEFYAPGWKILEDTDRVIELWCVWSRETPETDFTFAADAQSGGWFVTGYHGGDSAVTVPASYDGAPVTGVAAGAFDGCGGVDTLVLPPSLRVIEPGAFAGMETLTTLHLYDSLDTISNAAFEGDDALTTIYIGAATAPVYTDWFNSHAKKIEIMRYWQDDERPLLIMLGGSSASYAVDAQQLEGLLDRDYVVLNCGTNGANLFTMTSEWAAHFMDEGDMLLQMAEYSAWQLGGVTCAWETFRSFESCYNVFSWVRLSRFLKFFDCFQSYLTAKKTLPAETYEAYSTATAPEGYYDSQGTLRVVTAPNGSDDFWQGRSISFLGEWLYDYMFYYANSQFAKIRALGADCAMTFAPLNRNSVWEGETMETVASLSAYLNERLDVAIITDPASCILDPAVFFDDDYHIAAPERAAYTERLAADLNAYFAASAKEETAP